MSWFNVMPENDLREGLIRVVQAGNTPVLLVRHQGEVHAVGSRCPHMGLPLAPGRVDEEGALRCPWHRSAFDLRTGDVKDWVPWPPAVGPMLGRLSRERALPVYPVKIEEGAIWVQVDASESQPAG